MALNLRVTHSQLGSIVPEDRHHTSMNIHVDRANSHRLEAASSSVSVLRRSGWVADGAKVELENAHGLDNRIEPGPHQIAASLFCKR